MGDGPILKPDEGSLSVELFLLLPLVVLVLVAGLQVVGVARARTEMIGAVRDGARTAATTPDPAKTVEVVRAALPPEWRERARISVTRPSVVGQPARVTLRVRHPLGAPFPSGLGVELSASATMLVER